MSDYKRITMREFAGVTGDATYNRLAELEDKIESGELVDRNEYLDRLMAAKDISGMTDKEIEFFAKHNARVRENAEHRAEVAERALLLMARGECTFASPEFYKEEAEREVAKEEQIMANRCGEGKCEYFESTRRAANNNRENGYCKKYKQELHLYDWWWLKCDECTAEKKITEEQK